MKQDVDKFLRSAVSLLIAMLGFFILRFVQQSDKARQATYENERQLIRLTEKVGGVTDELSEIKLELRSVKKILRMTSSEISSAFKTAGLELGNGRKNGKTNLRTGIVSDNGICGRDCGAGRGPASSDFGLGAELQKLGAASYWLSSDCPYSLDIEKVCWGL